MVDEGECDKKSVVIVYASQQGTAKGIAEDLHEQCCAQIEASALLCCASELSEKLNLIHGQHLAVFVVATTGDGEPPDTARCWWRHLSKLASSSAGPASDTPHKFSTDILLTTADSDILILSTDDGKLRAPSNSDTILSTAADAVLTTAATVAAVAAPAATVAASAATVAAVAAPAATVAAPAAETETFDSITGSCVARDKAAVSVTEIGENTQQVENKAVSCNTKLFSELDSAVSAQNGVNITTVQQLSRQVYSQLHYTVLGLGDTNYNNFCNFGKNLDKKLQKLGAKRFFPCGWADDGIGLELVIEPWLEGFWESLSKALKATVERRREIVEGHTHNMDKCCARTRHNEILCEEEEVRPVLGKETITENITLSMNQNGETRGKKEDMEEQSIDDCLPPPQPSSNDVCDTTERQLDLVRQVFLCVGGMITHETSNAISKNKVYKNRTNEIETNLLNSTVNGNTCSQNKDNDERTKVEQILDIRNGEIDGIVLCNGEDIVRDIETLTIQDTKRHKVIIDDCWRHQHVLLQSGLPPEAKLTIPKCPAYNKICIQFSNTDFHHNTMNQCHYQNGAPLPSADSAIVTCGIKNFELLTELSSDKVKKTVELTLILPEEEISNFKYEPGDSIAVLARNSDEDVMLIIDLLNIENPDQLCTLTVADTVKKPLPAHIPPSCSSLREILSSCVDLRCIPKKAIMLYLLQCISDPQETRCMQELLSREGAELYRQKVLESGLKFLDILTVFISCKPDISVLLQILPRLLPRAYSLTSSFLNDHKTLAFAYNLVSIPKSNMIFSQRHGICTGSFDTLYEKYRLETKNNYQLNIYLRNSKTFRPPEDPSKPLILVGPGTGLAPLMGFMRHRDLQIMKGIHKLEDLGTIRLFFGCRYQGKDEIYREELEELSEKGILTYMHKCFSREQKLDKSNDANARYVQDLIGLHGNAVAASIVEADAYVYVCGDAKNMAKDVLATFVNILGQYLGSADEGLQLILQRQKDKKYIQDIWT